MRLWKRNLSLAVTAAMMAAVFSGTALAKEDRTKITSVELTIDSDIVAGEEDGNVSVTTGKDTYDVSEVEIVNDDGEWLSGDVPRVEITLEADSDYYFASMSSSKVKLKGDDATYVSSHREDDNSTLVVTIKLDALEGSMEIDSVEWRNDNAPIAEWENSDGAKSYQVRLYRGSSSVGESVTTTNTYYDFSSKITRTGEYYFKVRAVDSNSKKGDWYESDSVDVDDDLLARIKSGQYAVGNGSTNTVSAPGGSQSAVWMRNDVGWWYQYPDGTYPTNGWLQINSIWYCFDASGYMRTGWIQASNGAWYYCDPREGSNQGAMLTNTRTPDGLYVDANGVWIQGR